MLGKNQTLSFKYRNSAPGSEVMPDGKKLGIKVRSNWASLLAHLVKNLLAMLETPVPFPGREDLLEKG